MNILKKSKRENADARAETRTSAGSTAVSTKAKPEPLSLFLTIELVLIAALFCAIVVPKFFGIVPDVVLSNSMESSAPAGSIAYLNTNIDPTSLQAGDIAAYQATSETSVLHRVQAVNSDGTFTFKGDANNVADAAFPTSSEILGKYMFCIPYAGYIYMWIAANPILTIALILAANLIAYAAGKAPVKRAHMKLGIKAMGLADKVPVETKG